MVAAPVRDPPVEMSVSELLALDPFNNLKKQFMVMVVITRLGSDNRWWFLSCRKWHKIAYVSGRQYRCSDHTCPSINADPSYCVCTFRSDGAAEAEFMWFDKAARSVVGKPLMTLIQHKYPSFTGAHDLAQIGGGDVTMPVEISRIVTQKYVLVVSISNKSFQPTSTQLSFQVSRIDQTFKPELAPLGFGGASSASGASSSAENSGAAVPTLASFPMGSSTLTVLPLDEMNTPISAFKGKGQAIMPKMPSKSPCPQKSRRKLFTSPSNPKGSELPDSTVNVAAQAEKSASTRDAVEAASVPNQETKQVSQETETAAAEDGQNILSDLTKPKRTNAAGKGAGIPKKAR